MCGIAGEVNYSKALNDEIYFNDMSYAIKRRGPDQDGKYTSDCVTLVHTRLSVVDIENGKQPMIHRVNGREYCVIYNGELYNTEDIRSILKSKGHSFIGHSDTEVLLKSYIEWGQECVKLFNGIFAFAIWDKLQQRLFIARDRMGVKPFFYCIINNQFIFASEIKAILKHPDIKAQADINSIAEIIFMGPGRTPGTGVFKNIYELCPATCGFYSKGGLKTYKYWELKDKEHTDNLEQTIEKTRWLVCDAIERQLVSDVPICTFLSGGLDSSIISALAKKNMENKGQELNTFSVDYKDNSKYFKNSKFQPDSDDGYIKIMNKFLGVQHHNIIIDTPQLVNALFLAVDARDLPGMADVDSSLLLFCQQVKRHATVALSGECADEIFGGYPWYRDEKVRNTDGFPWAQTLDFRKLFLKDEFARQIDANEYVYSRYQQTLADTHKIKNLTPQESRMKEMMKLNLEWFMQTLLDRKDRMSMYNGLEVRVPFCDYRIAEYLYCVPWEYKDYKGREKGLLRKSMEGLLPDEVLWRKKSPYPKTHNPSYLKAVSELLKEIINNPSSPLLKIVKKEELNKLLSSDISNPWYGQLMTTPQTISYFVQVNYWLKKYNIKIV